MPNRGPRPRRPWCHFKTRPSLSTNARSESVISLSMSLDIVSSNNYLQMLLERGDSPYSQLLATTTLTKLISRTAQVLSLQQRIDISKSCLMMMRSRPLTSLTTTRKLRPHLLIQPAKVDAIRSPGTRHTVCQDHQAGLVRFQG